MKQFTIIKIGYTAGKYGCSNEFFTCIFTHKSKIDSFGFYGMYGVDERVTRTMKDKGYTEYYTPSFYGKMVAKDTTKWHQSERQAIDYINNGFKD